MQTISIESIGSIQYDKSGNIILFLLADKSKDVSHTIKLSEHASKLFMQEIARLIWFKLASE